MATLNFSGAGGQKSITWEVGSCSMEGTKKPIFSVSPASASSWCVLTDIYPILNQVNINVSASTTDRTATIKVSFNGQECTSKEISVVQTACAGDCTSFSIPSIPSDQKFSYTIYIPSGGTAANSVVVPFTIVGGCNSSDISFERIDGNVYLKTGVTSNINVIQYSSAVPANQTEQSINSSVKVKFGSNHCYTLNFVQSGLLPCTCDGIMYFFDDVQTMYPYAGSSGQRVDIAKGSTHGCGTLSGVSSNSMYVGGIDCDYVGDNFTFSTIVDRNTGTTDIVGTINLYFFDRNGVDMQCGATLDIVQTRNFCGCNSSGHYSIDIDDMTYFLTGPGSDENIGWINLYDRPDTGLTIVIPADTSDGTIKVSEAYGTNRNCFVAVPYSASANWVYKKIEEYVGFDYPFFIFEPNTSSTSRYSQITFNVYSSASLQGNSKYFSKYNCDSKPSWYYGTDVCDFEKSFIGKKCTPISVRVRQLGVGECPCELDKYNYQDWRFNHLTAIDSSGGWIFPNDTTEMRSDGTCNLRQSINVNTNVDSHQCSHLTLSSATPWLHAAYDSVTVDVNNSGAKRIGTVTFVYLQDSGNICITHDVTVIQEKRILTCQDFKDRFGYLSGSTTAENCGDSYWVDTHYSNCGYLSGVSTVSWIDVVGNYEDYSSLYRIEYIVHANYNSSSRSGSIRWYYMDMDTNTPKFNNCYITTNITQPGGCTDPQPTCDCNSAYVFLQRETLNPSYPEGTQNIRLGVAWPALDDANCLVIGLSNGHSNITGRTVYNSSDGTYTIYCNLGNKSDPSLSTETVSVLLYLAKRETPTVQCGDSYATIDITIS